MKRKLNNLLMIIIILIATNNNPNALKIDLSVGNGLPTLIVKNFATQKETNDLVKVVINNQDEVNDIIETVIDTIETILENLELPIQEIIDTMQSIVDNLAILTGTKDQVDALQDQIDAKQEELKNNSELIDDDTETIELNQVDNRDKRRSLVTKDIGDFGGIEGLSFDLGFSIDLMFDSFFGGERSVAIKTKKEFILENLEIIDKPGVYKLNKNIKKCIVIKNGYVKGRRSSEESMGLLISKGSRSIILDNVHFIECQKCIHFEEKTLNKTKTCFVKNCTCKLGNEIVQLK